MDYWRQLGILPPDDLRGQVAHMVGVGGIGSPTTIAMAKMGFPQIHVYDDDVVEPHNLPNQLYRLQDLGRLKVEAIQDIVAEFADTTVYPHAELFTSRNRPRGILVSAVHSMEARAEIWKAVRLNIQVPLYVEARMGAEVLKLYTLRPTDPLAIRRYEKTLHSSQSAFKAPCTERAISYTVFMAAALITSQIKKFLVGQPYSEKIVFDLKNLYLMVE